MFRLLPLFVAAFLLSTAQAQTVVTIPFQAACGPTEDAHESIKGLGFEITSRALGHDKNVYEIARLGDAFMFLINTPDGFTRSIVSGDSWQDTKPIKGTSL